MVARNARLLALTIVISNLSWRAAASDSHDSSTGPRRPSANCVQPMSRWGQATHVSAPVEPSRGPMGARSGAYRFFDSIDPSRTLRRPA